MGFLKVSRNVYLEKDEAKAFEAGQDRVFKTFLDKTIDEAGTGPTEPSMRGKFLMPFIEPEDTAIAPGSDR